MRKSSNKKVSKVRKVSRKLKGGSNDDENALLELNKQSVTENANGNNESAENESTNEGTNNEPSLEEPSSEEPSSNLIPTSM